MKKRNLFIVFVILILTSSLVFADELKNFAGWTDDNREVVHEVMDSTDWNSIRSDLDYGNLLEGNGIDVTMDE